MLDFLDEDVDPPRFLLNIYIEIVKNFLFLLDKLNEEMLIQTSDSENLFANAKQIKTLNDTKRFKKIPLIKSPLIIKLV